MIIREEEFLGILKKPKILLHVCCAPCATYVIDYLTQMFDITIFFYNPNIMDNSEYELRKEAVYKLAKIYNVSVIEELKDTENYLNKINGLEFEKEKGSRCTVCYDLRLQKTFENSSNFDFFATTLTLSPHKNTSKINELGELISIKYLVSDFKKRDGYKKSIKLSKKYDLYRQNYCGCVFSKRID